LSPYPTIHLFTKLYLELRGHQSGDKVCSLWPNQLTHNQLNYSTIVAELCPDYRAYTTRNKS